MAGKRARRSQKEIVLDKIAKIDESIKNTEDKLTALKNEKNELNNQLKSIEEAESQETIENITNKVAMAIKKNKITVEELEAFLTSENE